MRILVVDGDADCRTGLARALRRYGNVDLAGDGLSALAAFSCASSMDSPYGLVFLTPCVGGMDALGLLKSMRALERDSGTEPGRGMKVVMLGDGAKGDETLQSFRERCDASLSKPFSQADLDACMAKLGLLPKPPTNEGMASFRLAPPRSGHCALVVDDSATNILLMVRRLREAGYDFKIAWNGADALERLESSVGVELMFMDCEMPVMGGREAIARIRGSRKGYAGTRIVCTSSKRSPDGPVPEECRSCGADAVLGKPVIRKTLEEALSAVRSLSSLDGAKSM